MFQLEIYSDNNLSDCVDAGYAGFTLQASQLLLKSNYGYLVI